VSESIKIKTKCKHCDKDIERYPKAILPNGNFCSHSCRMKAQVHTSERKEHMSNLMTGSGNPMYNVKCTEQRREKVRKSNQGINMGVNNGNWNGGTSKLTKLIRSIWEYSNWRHIIFERDDYKCLECGGACNELNAHHLKPLQVIMDEYNIDSVASARGCKELWNSNNGITLCRDCHIELHASALRMGECPRDRKPKGMPKAGNSKT